MTIAGRAHCLFEQSGTFKREFIKLGIPAEDYDIRNDYGQTDHVLDLFGEIRKAYGGASSLFDTMTKDDIIMAFFPCIYFEVQQQLIYTLQHKTMAGYPLMEKVSKAIERTHRRAEFHELLYQLYTVASERGLRLVIENPANGFITSGQNFVPPTFIDTDRTRRWDLFVKPTAWWFVNCEPTHGLTEHRPTKTKTIEGCGPGKDAGLCCIERSVISPEYARAFICDNMLALRVPGSQLDLFGQNNYNNERDEKSL